MNYMTSAVSAVLNDSAGRVLLCQQRQGHRLWSLPGGRVRPGESLVDAVVRETLIETGIEVRVTGLVGMYHLTGDACGEGVPDLYVHVFRGSVVAGEAAVNAPGRISRLAWHDPEELPEPLTATTRTAVLDAVAGRAGVIRDVKRDPEPDIPDAVEVDASAVPVQCVDAGR